MPTYMAHSHWHGHHQQAALSVASEALQSNVSPKTRQGEVTNPEEVLGAALAACYTLVLSQTLSDAGHEPESIRTSAAVDLTHDGTKPRIPQITLDVEVSAPGVDADQLQSLSKQADEGCPVSQALGGTAIQINAHFPKR